MSTPSLGAFSQLTWFGVGDIDECWVISTYWALVAAGIMNRDQLPSIHDFRAAAGRPDLPGPSGGNNYVIYKALKKYAPGQDVKMVVYGVNSFRHALQSGYIASLSINAKYLPLAYQHRDHWGPSGPGAHQVAVVYEGGKYYIMDPLSKEGSALPQISEDALRRAAGHLFGHAARTGFQGDLLFHAVLIKATKEQIKQIISGGKLPPNLPRDFNYQVTVRNYLDPWAAKEQYRGRAKRTGAVRKVDDTRTKR